MQIHGRLCETGQAVTVTVEGPRIIALETGVGSEHSGRTPNTEHPTPNDLWIAPGGLADQIAERDSSSREHALEGIRANVPRGELATGEEIAAVIVFLCSERAANVAGAAWSVDGGAVPVII